MASSTFKFRTAWSVLALWLVMDVLMLAFRDHLPARIAPNLGGDCRIAWFLLTLWLFFRHTPRGET